MHNANRLNAVVIMIIIMILITIKLIIMIMIIMMIIIIICVILRHILITMTKPGDDEFIRATVSGAQAGALGAEDPLVTLWCIKTGDPLVTLWR